jgi:hypothetical protein
MVDEQTEPIQQTEPPAITEENVGEVVLAMLAEASPDPAAEERPRQRSNAFAYVYKPRIAK